ncbi:MAG: transpeptidase family protein [Acidobacteria bacterium]|nr:transpeptidase family protein [Acidobacteriota bacterium]
MQEPSGKQYPGGPHEPQVDHGAIRRLRTLARFAFGWAGLIVLRLLYLQIYSYDDYSRLAQSQQEAVREIPAMRGMLLDRNDAIFAKSNMLRSVVVNPMHVRDVAVTAEVLARVLTVDRTELEKRIQESRDAGRGFLWVKRKISFDEGERVKQLKMTGIEIRDETQRTYPKGELLAHVIGGKDHEEKGNAGIELGLDEELDGIPGTVRMFRDVTQHGYESVVETEPLPGKNIWLTIDERLQFVAERELKAAAEGCHCKSGSVVVLHPETGDILAMASFPTFDPNTTPNNEEEMSARLNQAIAAPFEPGSVFKVITLSAALESTRLGPDSPINCLGGTINLYGRVIHEAKRGFGVMPMRMVLAKSSNVGAIQVALQVGVKNLHHYVKAFGFGKRVGLPLPAEEPGQVFEPRKWGKTSIGSVAMGHEVTTTTIQLAQAASVVANHGRLVKPRIVLKRQRPGEVVEWEPVAAPVVVMKPENSERMKDMMHDVVLPGGTGYPRADLVGYTVGGKTGSAQIYDHKSKQYSHKYNASFIGMAPLGEPKVVIAVTLNGSHEYGGIVAAPVFKEVATAALRILDVRHDRELKQVAKVEAPAEAANDAADAPPQPMPEGAIDLGGDGTQLVVARHEAADGARVPNLVGKTKRDVLTLTAASGIPVEAHGAGIARRQNPLPGSLLRPGERLVIQFSR